MKTETHEAIEMIISEIHDGEENLCGHHDLPNTKKIGFHFCKKCEEDLERSRDLLNKNI